MRTSVFLAICCLLAGAARAQDLNVISGVEVKDEGNTVRLTVKGSKAPNFTTFPMTDPPRFVIDFSESRLQGVPEEVRSDNGLVTLVKNLSYGSGASSIARVMIAFAADVEPPDVRIEGNALVVSVMRPAGLAAPAVAAAAADDARIKAEAEERARQDALDREQADREARAQAEAEAQRAREAQARADADARARAEAEAQQQQAREEAAARMAADARRAAIAATLAAEAARAAETTPPVTSPPPAVPPAVAAAPPPEAAPAAPVIAAAPAAAAVAVPEPSRASEAPVAARADAPAAAVAPPSPEQQARAEARAESRARKSVDAELAIQQGAERIAQRVAEVPAPPPAPTLPPARPGKLNAIGFQQLATVSRVFVRTSTPPHYTISDVGDDVVRVELENTRATRRNDTRPLDTSFFPSAVAMITPSKQGSSYVVDIRLKKRVPYQQKLEGDVLAIDFERPAPEAAAAGTPEEGAATVAPRSLKRTEATLENEHGMIVNPEEPAAPAPGAPAGEPPPADGTPASPKQ